MIIVLGRFLAVPGDYTVTTYRCKRTAQFYRTRIVCPHAYDICVDYQFFVET